MSIKQRRVTNYALATAFFALAWWLRVNRANAFVTWDEPAWTYRSARFLVALGDGRLCDTLQVGHPGVLTMWSGALGLLWHRLVTGQVTAAQLRAVQALPALQVHDAATMRLLAELLPSAKDGLLLLQAVASLIIYRLLDRLLPKGAALLAALLVLFDPFNLALTRVLHIDGLTSAWMLISLLSLMVWRKTAHRRWLIGSGVALGLGVLTKTYAAMVVPVELALILMTSIKLSGRPAWRPMIGAVLRWGLAATGAFVLLWPAMWRCPWHVIQTMVGLSYEYATSPGDATTSFFRGALSAHIGAEFYPVVLFLRTTPTVLVGCLLALGQLVLGWRHQRGEERYRALIALGGYAACYLVLISLGAKKFDRYALPALLALDLVAAWGYWALWTWAADHWRRLRGSTLWASLGIAIVALSSVLWLAPYYPSNYLAHYDALAGGPTAAAETLPLGWGEGIEQVAAYLSSMPNADHLQVATWAVAGLAPRFSGALVTPEGDNLVNADYVLLTIGDVQSALPVAEEFMGVQQPVFVAEINGQPYAWLYANDYADALAVRLHEALRPGDLVVTDLPSTLERYHSESLPLVRIDPGSEEQVAATLKDAGDAHSSSPGSRIYRVKWIDDVRADTLQWQLEQHCVLLSSEQCPYGELLVYSMIDVPDVFQPIYIRLNDPERPAVTAQWESLALLGAGLAHEAVYTGQRIGVALRWQALTSLGEDYQLYLHLVDGQGRKWGQRDLPLKDALNKRTSSWVTGTEHVTRATVPLRAGVVPGTYTLVAGLYRWQDGQPIGEPVTLGMIPVLSGGQPPDLAEMDVVPGQGVDVAPGIELLEHHLSTDSARTGESVELWLTWRCSAETEDDWHLEVTLQGDERGTVHLIDPAGVTYPSSRWRAGEVLVYPATLRISGGLPSGRYTLSGEMLKAHRTLGSAPIALGEIEIENVERQVAAPGSALPMDVRFGQAITLAGYDVVARPSASHVEDMYVALYWRAEAEQDSDLTVFCHLLDEQGALRAQVDAQPVQGARPTSGWVQGEVVWDSYAIPFPDDAPAGRYQVAVGLYDAASGQRATAIDAKGAPIPDNRLLLPKTIYIRR